MSLAHPRPTTAPQPPAAATPAATAPAATTPAATAPAVGRPLRAEPGPSRRDGLRQSTGRLLAGAFGVAWILCPAIEPMSPGEDVHYPLWQLPIDLAALAAIVAAVVALWRGSRNSARLGMAAGVMMAVETIVCPLAGHTPVGWWTWVQTGLSLFVMTTSAALYRRVPGPELP
jgi:hypothetical protein